MFSEVRKDIEEKNKKFPLGDLGVVFGREVRQQ
jgi:hypothetical protein